MPVDELLHCWSQLIKIPPLGLPQLLTKTVVLLFQPLHLLIVVPVPVIHLVHVFQVELVVLRLPVLAFTHATLILHPRHSFNRNSRNLGNRHTRRGTHHVSSDDSAQRVGSVEVNRGMVCQFGRSVWSDGTRSAVDPAAARWPNAKGYVLRRQGWTIGISNRGSHDVPRFDYPRHILSVPHLDYTVALDRQIEVDSTATVLTTAEVAIGSDFTHV